MPASGLPIEVNPLLIFHLLSVILLPMKLKPFTCIGHWQSAPGEPIIHHVTATDALSAIKSGEEAAANDLGEPISPLDPYINTFVLAGHPEVLSSWAG